MAAHVTMQSALLMVNKSGLTPLALTSRASVDFSG
jgi:hypothetical protein